MSMQTCGYIGSMPVYKIVMIGPAGSGKTSLIKRFQHDSFSQMYTPTIDDMYSSVIQRADGSCLQLELIDTCGSLCFPAMLELRIKTADVLVIVFSLADVGKGDNLAIQNTLRDIFKLERKLNQRLVLVGNKSDLISSIDECNRLMDLMIEQLHAASSNQVSLLSQATITATHVTTCVEKSDVLKLFNSLFEVLYQPSDSGELDNLSPENRDSEGFSRRKNSELPKILSSLVDPLTRRQSLAISELYKLQKGNKSPKMNKKLSLCPESLECQIEVKGRSHSIDARFPPSHYLLMKKMPHEGDRDNRVQSLHSTPSKNKRLSIMNINDEYLSLKITQEIGHRLSMSNENNFISINTIADSADGPRQRSKSSNNCRYNKHRNNNCSIS